MFFWRGKFVASNRRDLTYTPPAGSLWEGEGNGNYRNATIPVTIPGSIPGDYGKSHPWNLWFLLPGFYNRGWP